MLHDFLCSIDSIIRPLSKIDLIRYLCYKDISWLCGLSTMVCPDFAALAMDFQLLQPPWTSTKSVHPAKEPLVSWQVKARAKSTVVLSTWEDEDRDFPDPMSTFASSSSLESNFQASWSDKPSFTKYCFLLFLQHFFQELFFTSNKLKLLEHHSQFSSWLDFWFLQCVLKMKIPILIPTTVHFQIVCSKLRKKVDLPAPEDPIKATYDFLFEFQTQIIKNLLTWKCLWYLK